MPDRLIVCAALLLLFVTLSSGQPRDGSDRLEYEKAISTLLCDCGCHPQSVKACACGRAAELRNEMQAMIAGGMDGEEVIADYVARKGEQIRIAPVARGFNLVAWLGPLIGLIVTSVGMVWVIWRWSKNAPSEASEPACPTTQSPEDEHYRERLRAALERME